MARTVKRAFKYRSALTDWKETDDLAFLNQVSSVGCGARHDRDVNAARNIVAAGPAVSTCGAGVRPQRASSRTGQSVTKQETQPATVGIPRP